MSVRPLRTPQQFIVHQPVHSVKVVLEADERRTLCASGHASGRRAGRGEPGSVGAPPSPEEEHASRPALLMGLLVMKKG
jgi:hypothetical protein